MNRNRVSGGLLLAITCLGAAGCSGNNETPASFDPVELALVRIEPGDGESAVARNRIVRMTFNTTVLPETVNDQAIRVRTGDNFRRRPEGAFLVSGNVVEFDPTVTADGGENALGFPAGVQILVEIPVFDAGSPEPAENFLQNIEGNPIATSSGPDSIAFTTGAGWDDVTPGPPGVLRVEFTPPPNAQGQVDPAAAVTLVFSEPVDPASVLLGSNVFVTNNTQTSPDFQQGIPAKTFFDGSLRRFSFLPVFGYGPGPFNILVNFIDPLDPENFDPNRLPRDLGGNALQNFTFVATFDTQFDADAPDGASVAEDFLDTAKRDTGGTDALWSTDPELPFSLVGRPITNRVATVDVSNILARGGSTAIPDTGGGPPNEGAFCSTQNTLIGPDATINVAFPPSAAGRRIQNVYRAAELGGPGTLIRAAWAPAFDQTFASTHPRVVLRLGHKRRATNLVDGSLTAEFDVDGFVTVADRTGYTIEGRTDVNGGPVNDGFYDWPEFETFFEYDGTSDLLVDVEATEGTVTQRIRLFEAVDGPCTCGVIIAPGCTWNNSIGLRRKLSTFGSDVPAGDVLAKPNPTAQVELAQFEFATLRSTATSLWYDTGTPAPDYLAPLLLPLVQPGGATVTIEYSASSDGITEEVPFTPNLNACDGFRFLRWRIVLRSNIFTGVRPRVQRLEIPFLRTG